MPKSFKTYDEQIEDLKKEKGLNITDESAARKGKVINPSYRRNLLPEEMLTVLLFKKVWILRVTL